MRSDLAFELELQTRCVKALILHRTRDSFRLYRRLVECDVRIEEQLSSGENEHTAWTG